MGITSIRNGESRDEDTARGNAARDGGSTAADAPAHAGFGTRLAWLVAIWAAGVAAVGTLSFLIRLWLRP